LGINLDLTLHGPTRFVINLRFQKSSVNSMEKFSMDEEILTIREVADLLKLHPKTINKFAISGKLPAYRIGRQWRFRKSEILKVLEKRDT
jgi:excisionase family DNA binding protein